MDSKWSDKKILNFKNTQMFCNAGSFEMTMLIISSTNRTGAPARRCSHLLKRCRWRDRGGTTDSEKQFVFKTRPTERRYHGDGCYEEAGQISCWWDRADCGHGRQRPACVHLLFCLFAERTLGWAAAPAQAASSQTFTAPRFVYTCAHVFVHKHRWAEVIFSLTRHSSETWSVCMLQDEEELSILLTCAVSSYDL